MRVIKVAENNIIHIGEYEVNEGSRKSIIHIGEYIIIYKVER